MNSFLQFIQPVLKQENVSAERFKDLLLRLLDYGVLCRDESQTEQQYYDVFVRLENPVVEYFDLLNIRVLHDTRFEFVRLVPPGARVPGVEDLSETPFNGGLRSKLPQQDVAVVLVLRAEYDKSLREGQIDEQGCVRLSLEALAIALKNLLQRQLPEGVTERRAVFRRLRQLRLIEYAGDDAIDQGDAWLRIRPLIVSFVSDEVLADLREGCVAELPASESDGEGSHDDDVDSNSLFYKSQEPSDSPAAEALASASDASSNNE
jgi:hypothetical protein